MKRVFLLLLITILLGFSLLANDGYAEKKLQISGRDSVYLVAVKVKSDSNGKDWYKMGMLDTKENELLAPVYDYIGRSNSGAVFTVTLDRKIGLFSIRGEELLPVAYDWMDYLVDDYYTIGKDKKVGVFDRNSRKIVIPVAYDRIDYKDSAIMPSRLVNKCPLPAPKVRRVLVYNGSAYSDRRVSLLDLYTGETIIPFDEYQYINYSDCYEFMDLRQAAGNWKMTDYLGKVYLTGNDSTYAAITPYGFIVGEGSYKKGFVPFKGKKVEAIYGDILFHDNGFAVVSYKDCDTGKFGSGVIDRHGELIVPPVYHAVYMDSTVVYVEKEGQMGVIDLKGKILFPPGKYGQIEYYPDTEVAVVTGNEESTDYGLVDIKGKVLIAMKYRNVYYADGIARTITHDYKYGMYNVKTKKQLSARYDGMDKFINGISVIGYFSAEGNRYGLLDEGGKEIVKPVYETMFFDDLQRYATVTLNGKHGMIGARGEVLVPVIFDRFTEYKPETDGDGLVVGEKDGKYGAYNFHTGKEILPLQDGRIMRHASGFIYFEGQERKYKEGR